MSEAALASSPPTRTNAVFPRSGSVLLQRKCACGGAPGPDDECEECRQKRLQRAANGAAVSVVPLVVHEALNSPGQPLNVNTRVFMESHFGHDFSQVRVHTDARAAESARAVNALAYTVGREIVFGAGQYTPATHAGRRLLAHELTHVVQQSLVAGSQTGLTVGDPADGFEREAEGIGERIAAGRFAAAQPAPATRRIQRDLATEPPAEPAPAQPDLTDQQIQEAIAYNRARYDAANTRLIQSLLGGPVTGTWTADNIIAIASTQEEYGLKKDGKVGPDVFAFLNREQQLEGMSTRTSECLTAFRVIQFNAQQAVTAGPGGTFNVRGHHKIEAQFSSRCNCSQFQYRQFIQGVATATRGAAVQDLSTMFPNIPGGQLPAAFSEDGNTTWASPNYGHREQAGQATTTAVDAENHYINDRNATDQANGCRYRGEDFPALTVQNLQTGDVVDLLVQFRGEIQRNGAAIQTKRWTDIDTNVVIP